MSDCPQIRTAVCTALLVIGVALSGKIAGETQNTPSPSATAMVRRCTNNLMRQLRSPIPIRFQERTDAPWGSEVRDVILTRTGRVDRLITIRDQPLTAAQDKKEIGRLNALLQKPGTHFAARPQDRELQRRLKLVAAIPMAFSFQKSVEDGSASQEFNFFPLQDFHPASQETRVYKGMRGILQMDVRRAQLLRVDGEIFRNVPFGWGILGKLHKGGHFRIEQREVLPGNWQITEMDFDFTYTVFLFSETHYIRKITNTAYTSIDPDTRMETAIGLLLSQPEEPSVFSAGAR